MIKIKEYTYGKPGKPFSAFYLEMNGVQFGTIMFSKAEAEQALKKLSYYIAQYPSR